MIKNVSFEEARAILDSNPDAILFDVREEEEYATAHAIGAEVFPVDSIDEKSTEILIPSKKTPVLVYCRSGLRSALAAQKLERLGFENIFDMGALSGWPYGTMGGF